MVRFSEVNDKLLILRLEIRGLLANTRRTPPTGHFAERHAAESRRLAAAAQEFWNTFYAIQGKANFDPNQPRVPRGNPDGGQWTDTGEASASLQAGRASSEAPPASSGAQSTLRVTITKEPGEAEGHIEGVTDKGDPRIWPEILLAGLPSGHHYGPQSFFRNLGLRPDTMKALQMPKPDLYWVPRMAGANHICFTMLPSRRNSGNSSKSSRSTPSK